MKVNLSKSVLSTLLAAQLLQGGAVQAQTQETNSTNTQSDNQQENTQAAFEAEGAMIIAEMMSATDEEIAERIRKIENDSTLSDDLKKQEIEKIEGALSLIKNMGLDKAQAFVTSEKGQTVIQKTIESEQAKERAEIERQANIKFGDAPTAEQKKEKEKEKQHWIEKEFDKFRLRITFDAISGKLADNEASYKVGYQLIVEPSLRNGEQARRDVYFINLNYAPQIYKKLYGNIGGFLRVTFTRYFAGNGAKWTAIKQTPYWLNKIPSSAADVQKKLKNGDTVRFEVLGRMGASMGTSSSGSESSVKMNFSVAVSYSADALFMMDLYKHSNKYIRMRFVGVKNRGTLSAHLTSNSKFSSLSLLNSALKVGINIGVSTSFDRNEKYPVETMMSDMTFNLESSQNQHGTSSVAVLDDLISQSRKFEFLKLFVPWTSSKELKDDLLRRLKPSQDIANEDRQAIRDGNINPNDFRVRLNFKGSMRSFLTSQNGEIKLTKLLGSVNQNVGTLKSSITAYTEEDHKRFFLLENSYTREGYETLLGQTRVREYVDTDVLLNANENEEPTSLSDISVKTTHIDKEFSKSDMEHIKRNVENSLPPRFRAKAQKEIDQMLPLSNQGSGTISYQYNFGRAALIALANTPMNELLVPLDIFLNQHNKNFRMNLPPMKNEGIDSAARDDFNSYLMKRSNDLARIFNTQKDQNNQPLVSVKEKHKLVQKLKFDMTFQKYILGEFISSRIPDDQSNDLMTLRLYTSTRETSSRIADIGDFRNTEVYNAVNFLRSIINDRNYDIRFDESTIGEDELKNQLVPQGYAGKTIKLKDE